MNTQYLDLTRENPEKGSLQLIVFYGFLSQIKCECYWPEELKRSCLYAELLVTLISEKKEPSWTLRDFRVQNVHHNS